MRWLLIILIALAGCDAAYALPRKAGPWLELAYADGGGGDVTDGLVHRWTFDETLEDSIGTNDLTAVGSDYTYVDGVHGKCVDLEDITDYFTVGGPGLDVYGDQSLSLTVWVKLKNASPTTANAGYWHFSANVTACYYVYTIGRLYDNTFMGARPLIGTASASIDREEWHLLSVTKDGTDWKFRQNTTLLGNYVAGAATYMGATCRIGAGTGNVFDGLMDDFRLYNRALTIEELGTLVENGP